MKAEKTLQEHTFDDVTYVHPTWNEMGTYTFELAKQILASDKTFDRTVALAKGGWTWARTLVDYLGIDGLSSMRIQAYKDIWKMEKPQIIQPLTDPVFDLNILLFDEVIDKGATIETAITNLRSMGVKSITTAALCYKRTSSIRPDFYAFSTSAWVVFPHEIREFIEQSYKTWKSDRKSDSEITKRLLNIGLPEEQVRFFVEKMTREE